MAIELSRQFINGVWQYVAEEEAAPNGGSQATDTVIEFAAPSGTGLVLPIVALDDATGTLEIDGDASEYFLNPNVSFYVIGSTGNDGNYAADAVTYDDGTDRTIVTNNAGSFPDATADGSVQTPVMYRAEVTLPAESSVEWIAVETLTDWVLSWYALIGDADDPEAFVDGSTAVDAPGVWQWPLNTIQKTAASVGTFNAFRSSGVLAGTKAGYAYYPDGGTLIVRFYLDTDVEVTDGLSRVIVHHHYSETATATQNPPLT